MRGLAVVLVLLIGAIAPPVASQTPPPSADFEVKDREGDVGLRQVSNPGPGVPVAPHIDLLALRVHSEDAEGLWIEIQVKQLRESVDVATPGGRGYFLQFSRADPALTYRISFHPISGGISNATPSFEADLCVSPKTGGGCIAQRASGHADYAQNRLSVYVPKLSLMGRNTVGENFFRQELPDAPLRAGDKLIEFRVESNGAYMLGDVLPDAGTVGPYTFKHGAANDRIRLALAGTNETEQDDDGGRTDYYAERRAAFPVVGVEAGTAIPVKLDVQNLNGAKRVINLTSAFADPKDASRFAVRVASNVAVPGNESRSVNVIVTALPSVKHRDEAILKVQARSIGFADELGATTLRLVASVPPSESSNTLYFHAADYGDASFAAACGVPTPFPMCDSQTWMNTLQDDPKATADKAGLQGGHAFRSMQGWVFEYGFPLDAPLARDVVLSHKTPVVGKIKVAGATEGNVQARLLAGDRLVGEGNQALKAGSEPVEVSFLPLLDATRIPSGAGLWYQVTLTVPYSNAQAGAARPTFALRDSSLELPVIADPNQTAGVAPSLGEAFLSLSVKGDRDEFVNPSEARAFQLTILNEGSIEDIVSLATTVVGDGCRAELRPGDKFRLESGDSARFGVLVHAPIEPKEGAQCKVRVNATSRVDPATVASQDLLVTITRGVDTPNDAENYTSDQESTGKLDVEPSSKKSPGPGVWGLGLVGLAAAWFRRRRSQL